MLKCVVEYRSAFDEEVLEAPGDSARAISSPFELEEAVTGEAEESGADVASPVGMREASPAETACGKPKMAFSHGRMNSSPFYYFYQG